MQLTYFNHELYNGLVKGHIMTESEWLASTDPAALLTYLSSVGKRPSDAKLRCWVEACRAANSQHNYIYDLSNAGHLEQAVRGWTWTQPDNSRSLPLAARADLLRHVVGPVHRPAVTRPCPSCGGSGTECPGTTCIVCEGVGWLDALPWERCERCQARGRFKSLEGHRPDNIGTACLSCKGRGRWLVWPAEVVQLAQACVAEPAKCEQCDGSGGSRREAGRPGDLVCRCCSGTGTVPASPPYYALADMLEEKGWPGLAEHFRAKCSQCEGKGELGESGGKLKKRSLGVWECGGCDGSGDLKHPRGCWLLNLLTNRE